MRSNGSNPRTLTSGPPAPETATSGTTRVLGIDPGLGGAICVDEGNGWLYTHRTPTLIAKAGTQRRILHVPAMWALLCDLHPVALAGLELQGVRPQEGVRSAWTNGYGYGIWYGLLIAAGIPFLTIQPQAWKKHWGLVKATKQASVIKALERYPQVGDGHLTEGQAEAMLIAGYVRSRLQQEGHE